MVLKKPYAFLIKHFRLIHLVLTLLGVFIAVESYRLVSFFTSFVANDYSATIIENLANEYINPLLYLAIVGSILVIIAMSLLLTMKKKPITMYIFAVIYYIILIAFLIIASSLLKGLEKELWSTAAARSYRDIALIVYYPQILVIFLIAFRAIGFNLKKFNFKNDLKEMEITDADNEEVEVNFNFDATKTKRKVRRFIRETGYYYQENKLIITLVAIAGVLVIGYTIYKNYEKTAYNYKQGATFSFNNLQLRVTNSMITNVDLSGNSYGKTYLVLQVEVTNNTNNDIELKDEYLRLFYSNKSTLPDLSISTYFSDYGKQLSKVPIKTKTKNTYVIPYVIDEKSVDSKFQLGIYIGAAKKKKFIAKSVNVQLTPQKYLNISSVKKINQGVETSLDQTLLKNSKIMFDNAEIVLRYPYKFESCYLGVCNTYNDVVVADPTFLARQALIVMDYNIELDIDSPSYYNITGINAFSEYFMKVQYGSSDTDLQVSKIKVVTPENLKDKLVIQTDGAIWGAEKVNLLITIRDRQYIVPIKNDD